MVKEGLKSQDRVCTNSFANCWGFQYLWSMVEEMSNMEYWNISCQEWREYDESDGAIMEQCERTSGLKVRDKSNGMESILLYDRMNNCFWSK